MDSPNPEPASSEPTEPFAEYRCVCGHRIALVGSVASSICPDCGREYDTEVLRAATAETAWIGDLSSTPATTVRPSIADQPDQLVGKHLDHFEVLQRIGGGGMGTVYRALDESLQRYVALKVLRKPTGADPEEIQSLFEEARAQARVNHPNVAHIYYVGRDAETPYLAMELVGKETLAQRMKREPIPFRIIIRIAVQVTQALQAAAKFDIVHGDIKPANVLMVDDVNVKLSDFGLAYRLSEVAEPTGITAGTPDYMPPEATRGNRIDHQGDMYSLGVTLFALTFGRMPYSVTSPTVNERLRQHRESTVEFPATWPVEIPYAWRAVLERLLQKQPASRYRDFEALLDDLQSLQPTSLPAASPLLRLFAWVVDGFLISSPLSIIALAFSTDPRTSFGFLGLLLAGGVGLTIAAVQSAWGTTPGKRLFQIRIVDDHGLKPSKPVLATRSVFQFLWAWSMILGSVLSLLSPTIPLLIQGAVMLFLLAEAIFVVSTNRAIHDRVLRTRVVLDAGESASEGSR